MQIPKRKPGKYAHIKQDNHITKVKFEEIQKKLRKLKEALPNAIQELQRLAALGDLSENAAYQMAKGKLRGINQRILELEDQLNYADIIDSSQNTGVVTLGSTVTIEINNKKQKYQILGSSETSPANGIISHNSPIGSVLIGRRVGDVVEFQQKDKIVECKIIRIE